MSRERNVRLDKRMGEWIVRTHLDKVQEVLETGVQMRLCTDGFYDREMVMVDMTIDSEVTLEDLLDDVTEVLWEFSVF